VVLMTLGWVLRTLTVSQFASILSSHQPMRMFSSLIMRLELHEIEFI